MFKHKEKDNKNFLEFIPVKSNSHISERLEDDSKITLVIKRDSKIDKFFIKIFKKAHKEVYIHFDDIGTYTWMNIDGNKTIYELSKNFMKDYDVSENEAINRMVQFIKTLNNNKFIDFAHEIC